MPSSLDLLKQKNFFIYWLAGLSANFGWQLQLVGASWLMTSLGRTPELVALVQTAVALPVMLLSLPGGALGRAPPPIQPSPPTGAGVPPAMPSTPG